MEVLISGRKRISALFLIVLPVMIWMCCSAILPGRGEAATGSDGQETRALLNEYLAQYYDFDDILIPGELASSPPKSFIYQTPQFKAGTMVFTRWWFDIDSLSRLFRRHVESLTQFFKDHMQKDHWKLVNSYEGKESFLSFSKPDRTCNILINEKWYGVTRVEIHVVPLTMEGM